MYNYMFHVVKMSIVGYNDSLMTLLVKKSESWPVFLYLFNFVCKATITSLLVFPNNVQVYDRRAITKECCILPAI